MTPPMRGWRVFGCHGDPGDPIVTALGGTDDWPDAELHHGVAGIEIRSYGDEPAGAFISVWGPDRDAVLSTWHAAAAAFPTIAPALWPTPALPPKG